MTDFWPACGHTHLQRTAGGWLAPTDAYWRHILARPELALVAESCPAEVALHQALQQAPASAVPAATLQAVQDPDARANYQMFLRLRDGLVAAGTLEAYYCGLFRAGSITIAPVFIDLIAQAVLRGLLDEDGSALEARAAELLFRPQRITVQQGRVLGGDSETLGRLSDGGGFGSLGRLLTEAKAPLRQAQLAVLTLDNAFDYWHDGERHRFLLDLTASVPKQLASGVSVALAPAQSGLAALARVLQRWVAHLLGVAVHISPVARIDDARWRWHVGLDAEATELLNRLYTGQPVDDAGMQRFVGLFKLEFDNPAEMQADVAGKPVYLGLAMNGEQQLRLKPQNLLLNLPLARAC